jgi:alginate O-acetyltransferase complex protein AlgI
MSLTNWLIDYIYIPLGGSRVRSERVYANILVTMFVSGIWHGAGVNFIVWGLLHGVMLAIHRAWRRLRPAPSETAPLWSRLPSWLLTYVAVNFAWAFFCMDVKTALFFFRRLLIG